MRCFLLTMLLMALSTGAQAEHVEIPLADGTMLKAELFLPSGPAIAPAIVALHGCGGPFGARDRQWRELLVGQGHIMLFPDSFSSRGLGPQCRVKLADRKVTSFVVRRADAIESAKWLGARETTPAGGIVLLGWSDGGSTVMAAASAAPNLKPDPEPGLVRGMIAFYPGCFVAQNPDWRPVAPLLVLMGDADDWTPAAPCRAVATRFPANVMRFVAFAGAYHDFDVPGTVRVMHDVPASANADKTVHAGNDPEAQAEALKLVPAFLASLPPAHP